MKNILLIFMVLLVICFIPLQALADSPVTSTPFYKAYIDVPMVKKAHEKGKIDQDIADYLLNKYVSIDKKAAVINALSWKFEGKNNAKLFQKYLDEFVKPNYDSNDHYQTHHMPVSKLDADDLFCLGYLALMDDYFNPDKAINILEQAHDKNPKSFTVAIILAIAKAQKAMDKDWEEVWVLTNNVLKDKSLNNDLNPEAKNIIVDYMKLYKE